MNIKDNSLWVFDKPFGEASPNYFRKYVVVEHKGDAGSVYYHYDTHYDAYQKTREIKRESGFDATWLEFDNEIEYLNFMDEATN